VIVGKYPAHSGAKNPDMLRSRRNPSAIIGRSCEMPADTVPNLPHAPIRDGMGEIRHDFIEMHMLEQRESGGAQDVRILQHLHGIPVAAPDQQRQRRARYGDQNGFLAGKQSMYDAIPGLIGKATRKKPGST